MSDKENLVLIKILFERIEELDRLFGDLKGMTQEPSPMIRSLLADAEEKKAVFAMKLEGIK